METSQRDQAHNLPHPLPQSNSASIQDPDLFDFLKTEKERPSSSPFFSENGLSQDIIKVTGAEPDVCLEAFYALYHTLWPQIESQSDFSFKDAWARFIGGSVFKGSLSPPEKLILERRVRDIKRIMSEPGGEDQIFHDLDGVVNSILNLKQKVEDYSAGEIFYKADILASLSLVQEFYQGYRNKVKGFVQDILGKEQMNTSYASESDKLEDLLEPKAIMMSDTFPHHWAYRIPRSQAQKLLSLDMHGRNLKTNLNDPANHRVIALPEKSDSPLVFFKANGNPPIQPEKEFMVYSLYKHLQIPVPETALLILTDVFETKPEYFYALQASEAIIGESALKACLDQETVFDHEAYVSQTIGAFLTNPSDGSFKNFKYNPIYQTLISIDNDLVFKPELTGKDEKKVVNVKSILYLLPQIDLPIPESIKTFFTSLDPQLTTYAWLQDLSQKNREYQLLFTKLAFQRTRCVYQNLLPQSQVPSLSTCLQQKVQVDHELHAGSFNPQVLISKDLLTCFIEKLQMIEKTLLANRSVSTQVLFEEIFPLLGKYYRKLRFEFSDIEEALEALWGNKKDGVDYSYISSMLDHEELNNLSRSRNGIIETLVPEMLLQEYKDVLSSGQSALDGYIRRQNQRKKKNSLNLRVALKELQLLVQEGLIKSHYPRDIIDFCHDLSKVIQNNHHVVKEILSLLSNLPHPELKWLLALENHFLRPDRHVPKGLITSSVEILGAFMKKRTFILTESENQYLFDQQGDILKNSSLTGRSRVTFFPAQNPHFYLKQYPEWPGYEFASTLFMRLLGIQHLPFQDLIVINSKYPVLLTQKVHGNPVLHIWHNSQALHNLDPTHTGLLIIAAMLINPEDGKEDNFILSEDGKYLIPIDNDHCFLPSTLQKEGKFWNAFTVNTALQTKTLLFCLDEMYMSIPLQVRQDILSLDFDILLSKWMTELDKLDNKINNLVDQQQRSQFLQQGTVMRIPFYKQFIHNIHWKAHRIQGILKTSSAATPFDLLKAVEPFAARCYQDAFKQGSNLQSRFKAATDQLYKKTAIHGSRVSILNTRTMMEIINVSEKDLQNDVMFQRLGPIDALELLNKLVQAHNENVRREQEMLCELDEKNQEKKWIHLFGNPPVETALKAFLMNPKEGLILKGSRLITSSRLTELFAQTPDKGMRIRFLSLPESPLLADKEIRILVEDCPNIEYLNVSGCLKLKQLLTREGEWPLLSRFEAKGCVNLERLASYSPMKILRVGTDKEIDIFVEKTTLDIFTISKESIKYEFSLKKGEDVQIKSQGEIVSNHPFLLTLLQGKEGVEKYFRDWKIIMRINSILSGKSLGVFITFLHLKNSDIKTEDIQRIVELSLINLKSLDLSQNEAIGTDSLEYLIQGDWPNLNFLYLSANPISDEGVTILSRGNWPLLEILDLQGTAVTPQKLLQFVLETKLLNLRDVVLDSNKKKLLTGFLPKNQTGPEELDLSCCNVTPKEIELIVSRYPGPRLKYLDLSENPKINDGALQTLLHAKWPLLEILDLQGTAVTTQKLLQFILETKLSNLRDIISDSENRKLLAGFLPKNKSGPEELDLSCCKVTPKEVELIANKCGWPQLKHLSLSVNKIKDEGVELLSKGDWLLLEILDLARTEITTRGVEVIVKKCNWPQLKRLNLSGNWRINDKALEVLVQGNWSLLETLNLKSTDVTKKGCINFIFNANFSNLKDVYLNWWSTDEVASLFQKNWPLLGELDLSYCQITQKELDTIVSSSKWPQLKRLNLSDNEKIDDRALKILTQGNWPLLETLNLNSTSVTKKGLINFIFNANFSNLKDIHFFWGNSDLIRNLLQKNWSLIEELDLHNCQITQNEIDIIAEKWDFPQLKRLNLSNNEEIDDEALEKLARGGWPQLEELDLNSCQITQNGIDVIVKKRSWPQLKHLNLSWNQICNEGLEKLTHGSWPLLETLNLKGTGGTKQGELKFIFHVSLFTLKRIYLNWWSSDTATNLFKKNWPLLEELNLSNCQITQKELDAIVSSSKWPQLKHLNLSSNEKIDDKALGMLFQGNWPLLETLNLNSTSVTKKGLVNFIFNENFSNLKSIHCEKRDDNLLEKLLNKSWSLVEELDLHNCQITQNEIDIIAKKWNFPQLKHLNLSNNEKIDDEALETLTRGGWSRLETLDLGQTRVTEKALADFLLNANWPKFKRITLPWNSSSQDLAIRFIKKDLFLSERLELNNFNISFAHIERVIFLHNYPNLKHLNITDKAISLEGIMALALAECPLLEELHLENTKLTLEGVETLVNRSKWVHLRHLNVSNNEICNEGVSPLALAQWPSLQTLNLRKTKLSLQGVESIRNQSKWFQLKHLDISQNEICDEGFFALAFAEWPLLENLNLNKTNLSLQGIESIINQSKWFQLKHLNISNNEIFDEGLSSFALGSWPELEELCLKSTQITSNGIEFLVNNVKLPNLKKLDISENSIFDEGLKTLASGNWPSLQHLVYFHTKVTQQGQIFLLENSKWPDLSHLEHSLTESFYNYDENSDEWSPPGIILAIVPTDSETSSDVLTVTVLDTNWLNSKEIFVSISHNDVKEKMKILPRSQLIQFESLHLTLSSLSRMKPLQSIALPSKLKMLHFDKNYLDDEEKSPRLFFRKCPLLEDIRLPNKFITKKNAKILSSTSAWPNLKKLDISGNFMKNQDFLAIASAKWERLESLNLQDTRMTAESLTILINKSNWSNLKKINISNNFVKNEGLERLVSAYWPHLEELSLRGVGMTNKGIESLVWKSDWPNLKLLDISFNERVTGQGFETLALGKWPSLEYLGLQRTSLKPKDIETLVNESLWFHLKELDLCSNSLLKKDVTRTLVYGKWPNIKLILSLFD